MLKLLKCVVTSERDGNDKGEKPQCLYAQSASPALDSKSSVKTALWVLKKKYSGL